jgi:hypothetical protein
VTAREQTAFAAGVEAARQWAMVAAITLENRNDAGEVRQRAAVAALQGLAAGLKETFLAAALHAEPVSACKLQDEAQPMSEAR